MLGHVWIGRFIVRVLDGALLPPSSAQVPSPARSEESLLGLERARSCPLYAGHVLYGKKTVSGIWSLKTFGKSLRWKSVRLRHSSLLSPGPHRTRFTLSRTQHDHRADGRGGGRGTALDLPVAHSPFRHFAAGRHSDPCLDLYFFS